MPATPSLTRRRLLATGAAGAAALALPLRPAGAAPVTHDIRLAAGKARVRIVPEPYAMTDAWCFNGALPGPEIRVRQGDRLRIATENGLAEETTVHWHGLRVPNAMDGVPYLTQDPIEPGGSFVYEFDAVDAGTFWYHPHHRSSEQVGRGLYGPLVVEEDNPPRVDRDVTWVVDDWRLDEDAAISGGFGNMHDAAHAGRLGNTVTVNGRVPDGFDVQPGERLRLRLVNAANARIFALDFGALAPVIVALDGQPVTPHAADGPVTLGPAMRVDLIVDMTGKPGERISVIDRFFEQQAYRLVDIVHGDDPVRASVPDWDMQIAANPLPEPDVNAATRHEIAFNGGMMGGMMMEEMGGMMGEMHSGRVWFVNGVAAEGPMLEPMLTLEKDRSHVLAMTNATAFHHPIHLHGHSFRVISRDGQPTRHREWQDTVLMAPREKVEIAFVADNPGDWMFHCHILEHQAAGMMAVLRVA